MQDPDEILFSLISRKSDMSFTFKTSLYQRNVTRTEVMDCTSALNFLREIKSRSRSYLGPQLLAKRAPIYVQEESDIEKKAAEIFNKTEPICKKCFDFTESTNVEFKVFLTKKFLDRIKDCIPRYVSAFANTNGGYLFFSLEVQEGKISSFEEKQEYFSEIESIIEKYIRNLPVYHFCEEKEKINYSCKFLEVHDEGGHGGYVCALRVERFCCAVFAEKLCLKIGDYVMWSAVEKWIKCLMDAEPASDPESANELREIEMMTRISEAFCRELFSQEEALNQLIQNEMGSVCQGMLIASKSWSLDPHLPKNEEIICDVLLISQDHQPVLYTFFRVKEELENGFTLCRELADKIKAYSFQTARTLKQKLVKLGGYTGKVCIMPKIFCLSPEDKIISLYDSSVKIFYPRSYYSTSFNNTMRDLLKALSIVFKRLESVRE